ncbi:CoA-transferase [Pseudonocardia oroxyli]|uniref:Glutaconate CoA-transferase subunit B n=1 Tax=Pseudonocardia oroxyli TaxID=366584 RepID=A0A1G7LL66_PSEOR|nr:CoA-transferase [Pseudonocardia oroxyli]SDF50153.1 glutaconate CoA-transferase subunit B [Pseudonocardia oroxyli]
MSALGSAGLVAAARLLQAGQVCVGEPGDPTAAARLAAATHAPGLIVLDGSLPRYSLRRAQVGLVTAAQIDAFGNLNTTVLGDYDEPTARFAGPGLLPDVTAALPTIVLLPHRLAAFVERVDFVTAPGGLSGPLDRALVGLPGTGPIAVVTDLGVLRPDPATAELVLTDLHPGVTVEQVRAETGWPLEVSADLVETAPPSEAEQAALTSSAA